MASEKNLVKKKELLKAISSLEKSLKVNLNIPDDEMIDLYWSQFRFQEGRKESGLSVP